MALTLTGNFTGSPATFTFTVGATETLAAIATGLTALVNADADLSVGAPTAVVVNTNDIYFSWAGTATSGQSIVITSAVTGSGNETVTVLGGFTGHDNVAIGHNALLATQAGSSVLANTAIGTYVMQNVTTANDNNCLGFQACLSATTMTNSNAFGYEALESVTTAAANTAFGHLALANDVTGGNNTALGANAMQYYNGTFGGGNQASVAIGSGALQGTSAGYTTHNDVAIGGNAGVAVTGDFENVFIGSNVAADVTSGHNMVVIGYDVGSAVCTTANSVILIGTTSGVDCPTGTGSISGWINVGNAYVASTTAPTVSSGFGATPSIPVGTSSHNFTVNVGTGGSATSGVISLSHSAPNGWICHAEDTTNSASFVEGIVPTSVSTITITNYSRTAGTAIAWTASDVLAVSCDGY